MVDYSICGIELDKKNHIARQPIEKSPSLSYFIQICTLLKHTLFIEYPEFCASYKLINVNNHQKYSDNIMLNVVNYILYRFGDRGNIERL